MKIRLRFRRRTDPPETGWDKADSQSPTSRPETATDATRETPKPMRMPASEPASAAPGESRPPSWRPTPRWLFSTLAALGVGWLLGASLTPRLEPPSPQSSVPVSKPLSERWTIAPEGPCPNSAPCTTGADGLRRETPISVGLGTQATNATLSGLPRDSLVDQLLICRAQLQQTSNPLMAGSPEAAAESASELGAVTGTEAESAAGAGAAAESSSEATPVASTTQVADAAAAKPATKKSRSRSKKRTVRRKRSKSSAKTKGSTAQRRSTSGSFWSSKQGGPFLGN